jgi:hypothetical protein
VSPYPTPPRYAISFAALQPRWAGVGSSDGGSSNGRTADSDSASLGSNPSPPANLSSSLENLDHRFNRYVGPMSAHEAVLGDPPTVGKHHRASRLVPPPICSAPPVGTLTQRDRRPPAPAPPPEKIRFRLLRTRGYRLAPVFLNRGALSIEGCVPTRSRRAPGLPFAARHALHRFAIRAPICVQPSHIARSRRAWDELTLGCVAQ